MNAGRPDFNNIVKDSEIVFEFIKKKNSYLKIGVHGISMGGLACSYLAR